MFGRPIGKNQGIAFPLADAHAKLARRRARYPRGVGRIDPGLPCGEEANLAKFLAAEAGFDAADRAVQTHGGFGYATEYHVERYWREARLLPASPRSARSWSWPTWPSTSSACPGRTGAPGDDGGGSDPHRGPARPA